MNIESEEYSLIFETMSLEENTSELYRHLAAGMMTDNLKRRKQLRIDAKE